MKKAVLILISVFILCTSNIYAQVPSITATASITPDKYVVIEGATTNDTAEYITLIFGNENAFVHIAQSEISDGQFLFRFKLDNKVPPGEYKYRLGTGNSQFTGILNVSEEKCFRRDMVYGELLLTITQYKPHISGTIYCEPGAKMNYQLKFKNTNTVVCSDEIDTKDGVVSLDIPLPSLSTQYTYTFELLVASNGKPAISASLDVESLYVLSSLEGFVTTEKGYVLRGNVESEDIDRLNKSLLLREQTTREVDLTVPNMLYNCSFKITFNIIEYADTIFDGSIRHISNPELYNALKNKFPYFDNECSGIISPQELATLNNTLDLSGYNIKSLSGMQSCTGITHLYLNDNLIEDISPLLLLDNLVYLNLDRNIIKDIYRLPPNLRYLTLSGNHLEKLENFNLTDTIVHLNLSDNNIENVSQLNRYKLLQYLDIRNNKISDIGPLPQKKYAKLLTYGNISLKGE